MNGGVYKWNRILLEHRDKCFLGRSGKAYEGPVSQRLSLMVKRKSIEVIKH